PPDSRTPRAGAGAHSAGDEPARRRESRKPGAAALAPAPQGIKQTKPTGCNPWACPPPALPCPVRVLAVADVIALEVAELLLDGVGVVLVVGHAADHHAALAQALVVGGGVLLRDAGADQRADEAARDRPGAPAGQCRGQRARDHQAQAREEYVRA